MAETTMRTERGEFIVKRPHTPASSPLRAWSAADVLALDHLARPDLGRVLIVNDEFGALTCGLAIEQPVVWSDSALSRSAIAKNLGGNSLVALGASQTVRGDDQPTGVFDTIIVRIPKTAALLEYQLGVLTHCSTQTTTVIGAGMARHIHSSTVRSFETLVGPTTTSRATQKARLIHSTVSGERPAVSLPVHEFTTDAQLRVAELPGTFSAGHLDVGTALLLEVLRGEQPQVDGVVADLGCGNGVLAAAMAHQWPEAEFVLFDVSDLAVAAARKTWQLNQLAASMSVEAADGYGMQASDSVNVVITNPPFHQGHALDADMTDRLLRDTVRVLTPDGVAYVVAQRHLNLHTRMQQWFSTVDVVSKHPSHVVLRAKP